MSRSRMEVLAHVSSGLALAVCVGCSAAPVAVTPAGATVTIGRSDAADGCTEIGPIEVSHGHGCGGFGAEGDYAGAYAMLKNEAADRGANYVRLDQQVPPYSDGHCAHNEFTMRGVAFRCPP